MMVPDSEKRLQQAVDDLREFVHGERHEGLGAEGEWYEQAQAILAERVGATNNRSGENDLIQETEVDDLAEGEVF